MKGPLFENFVDGLGIREDVYAAATKRVLAWQMEEAMKAQKLSKNKMAEKMATSRSQLNRLLDPENDSVQLDTIIKAANVLGRKVRIELVEADPVVAPDGGAEAA